MRPHSRALLLALAWAGVAPAALAQTAPGSASTPPAATNPVAKAADDKPKRHKFDPYQSPLATIMQFRLHADVPEAQDFVQQTRPDKKTLKYTPLQSQLGPEPVRPKPRDAAGIDALKAEMEASIAHNEARVAGHGKGKTRRAKSDTAAN